MVNVLDKALRLGEGHQLNKLKKVAERTNALEEKTKALTDAELKAKTTEFKRHLEDGAKLDSLMPEAFAVVREASRRVLGMRHFDVQLMGGAALHWGNIAEMKTGEGKTLVATLPSYLNALEGEGVHVVTVNDYLAKYQSNLMGRVFSFLGMTTGCILSDMNPTQRRKQYNADITYGTNNEFGFDYLRDNMTWDKSELVQRGHHYAIVDEVDSILIDEARTPLIISGPAEGDVTGWYRKFARLVPKLFRGEDYEVDEKKKTVGILEPGIQKVEDYLGIDNLYKPENTPVIGYLNNAIKAKELFLRDKDYVVRGGEVLIVDEHTGRILKGRRYNEGLHQALEAKEGVRIQPESQTYATITLQNYFRMYDKLAGMTGTAETEAAEFMTTYKLGVLPIPTNKPMIRKDDEDLIYRTTHEKLAAVIKDVAKRHAKGQPVLLGTASVESSEVLSSLLDAAKIPHQVLNAKHNEEEARVVAMAGRKGAVTVATNMAGRGTDIMLGGNVEFLTDQKLRADGYSPDATPEEWDKLWGKTLEEVKKQVKDEHEEVKKLGGLYVLGTERHESRRIDNQLRGRSGRQGDPGESRFYLSLEDDLMRLFNTKMVSRVMARNLPEGEPIESKYVSRGVRNAQKARESQNFEIRKNVLKYDDVMNKQRTVVYQERQDILQGKDIHKNILGYFEYIIDRYVDKYLKEDKPTKAECSALVKALQAVYPVGITSAKVKAAAITDKGKYLKGIKARKAIKKALLEDIENKFAEIDWGVFDFKAVERKVVIAVLDKMWRDHLYEMDYLKEGIGLRGMGQRDPLTEYQREGYNMYVEMVSNLKEEVVRLLFKIKQDDMAKMFNEEEDEVTEEGVTENLSESDGENGAEESSEGGSSEDESNSENADDSQDGEEPADAQPETSAKEEPSDAQPDTSAKEEPQRGITVMEPLSHMDEKVAPSAEDRIELHSPWADKKVYPGTPKNAQCPCGSGRKYKVCHGRNEGLPDVIEVVTAEKKKAAQNLSKLVKKSRKANKSEAQEETNEKESSATEGRTQEEGQQPAASGYSARGK